MRLERETSEEPRIITHEVLNDRSLMNSRSFREPQAGRAKVAESIIQLNDLSLCPTRIGWLRNANTFAETCMDI